MYYIEQFVRNSIIGAIIRETLSQSIRVEIAKRKAYTKIKFRRISRPIETRSMRTYTPLNSCGVNRAKILY